MRGWILAAALGVLGAAAPAAHGAPPANDGAAGAAAFEPYTARNGEPQEHQGIAELAEAGPDPGVARCLGGASYERTVWFRVPPAPTARLVRVEGTGGSGDTNEVPDLAGYVQPEGAGPDAPSTGEAQACDGPGAGGAAAEGDGAAAVELRVPAGRAVLVQAGRPAHQRPARVVLSLRVAAFGASPPGRGDRAGAATPRRSLGRLSPVELGGATLTEEDPAQPACPAAATVWRRYVVTRSGPHVALARGAAVGALTVFAGARPSADGAVACENRAASGADVRAPFDATRGQTVWLRLGSDAPPPSAIVQAGLYGPGAAVPRALEIALPGGRSARSYARARRVAVRLRSRAGRLRTVRIVLERRAGPRYRTVARRTLATLRGGRRTTVRLPLRARVAPGVHRLRVTAAGASGPVRSTRIYRLRR